MFTKWINNPKSVREDNGSIEILAGPGTNLFISAVGDFRASNAPIYVHEADQEFTLICQVQPSFSSVYDAGAIMLYISDENWVKFAYERTDLGHDAMVSVVTNGVSDDANGEKMTSEAVWMKLTRKDHAIGLYYSVDGVQWRMVRLFQHQIKQEEQVYVGLLAQSPIGQECRVQFRGLEYHGEAVKDFRKGI